MKQVMHIAAGIAAVAITLGTPKAAAAQNIFSAVGGVCLNAEGGVRDGARIIGWNCSGAGNEQFYISGGAIRLAGTSFCVQADSRREGSELRLRTCNNDPNTQNFAFWSGNRIGHNSGYCVDLSGAGWFNQNNGANKPAVLWGCHGARNQQWFAGRQAPTSRIAVGNLKKGDRVVIAGREGSWTWNGVALIGNDGSTMVAAGGGNLIAIVGGQMVAAGGGNMVAAGGGN